LQPVELYTKRGLRGRIKEPVGTHGMLAMLEIFTINLITISILAVNYLMGRIQIICCLIKDVSVNSMILLVLSCFLLFSSENSLFLDMILICHQREFILSGNKY